MILDFQMKNVKYFSFNKARGGREGIKSSRMKRKESMICFKDKHGSSERFGHKRSPQGKRAEDTYTLRTRGAVISKIH